MPIIPQSTADQIYQDGLSRLVKADDGSMHVLYLDSEHDIVRSAFAQDWPPPLPTEPTQTEIDTGIATQTARRQQVVIDDGTLRSRVLALAQGAVGVAIEDLTAAQIKALITLLLWETGAIDRSGVVKPLSEWI